MSKETTKKIKSIKKKVYNKKADILKAKEMAGKLKKIGTKKNIILLIDVPFPVVLKVIKDVRQSHKVPHRFLLLYDKKHVGKEHEKVVKAFNFMEPVNFNVTDSIVDAISPYKDCLKAVFCRTEVSIPRFQRIIPHIPYLRTPNTQSLDWSLNKYLMRKRFNAYDKKITPKFKLVKDQKKSTLKSIEKNVGFPLVIKPSNLAQSLLVNIVYHQEELEKNLRQVFRKVNNIYKKSRRKDMDVKIIVEQYIEGNMYSIDGYVNSRGKVYYCPMVAVKTGKEIGFDDFFGYQQMTPTTLTKKTIALAERVTGKGVRALGLRSIVFHAELIKTDSGFQIVEIGPRIGGFRDQLYRLSYGINHIGNAVHIAIPKIPKINKRVKAHTAAMKFFARKEGRIKNLKGIRKAKELKSFVKMDVNKKIGNRAKFAKNGGKSVFNIILSNKDRSKLLADIRRLENMIKIEV